MIAVSDTSPICYLVLIGAIDLLPAIFNQIALPQAVIAELLHEDAPPSVREWASQPPFWTSVRENSLGSILGMETLQAGEQAAILLAESIHADIVLLDEKSARRAATNRRLRITGTLGVLGEAAVRGMLDLPTAIDRLIKTNFRCSPMLLKATLDRFWTR